MTALRNLVMVLAVACASVVAWPTTAGAEVVVTPGDHYAAIAYSPATGSYGYSYGCATSSRAEAIALGHCKGEDARIVCWVHNGFCALAVGDDRSCWGIGYTYGPGANNIDARQRALNECAQRTTGAHIVVSICSEN